MKVLVINCGSSSIKYQLFNMDNEEVLAKGLVERIGIEGSILIHKVNGEKYDIKEVIKDHKDGVRLVIEALTNKEYGVIADMSEISAVGHRVVHGGEKYASSVVINDEVMKSIEDCVKLAPLHNPPNIIGINACKEMMPEVPMVAVFDTAFHQTMPKEAYLYPIPYELYENDAIRKYGFHGTSHKYVTQKAAEMIGKNVDDINIITCHLGNGASLAAVKNGKSVDTSMGFTPLEGLCMGTRSGSIDPSIVTFLMKEKGYSCDEVDNILNKKSGLLGISGLSSDFRDIRSTAGEGVERSILARDIFFNKIRQYIGSYAVTLGKVDCIAFAGGIGENAALVRSEVAKGLEIIGAEIDSKLNEAAAGVEACISTESSKIKILVIPTDEELMIARDTKELCCK
ncbi:acetate kinase [Clostridium cellulovorans]|uniref:Acetate kinase n=1 Tax=Clostridium cellulovorans (strain ATCC 35296 / DSM 3052 / OCM 3 / 743B) TaxID=573061 RepID=D9SLC0_CLOC7|nr:acetate kinase [Clostridium cellulovorans]ADL51636.1 acetate kinase [Clostridium cellulovorans 743B]